MTHLNSTSIHIPINNLYHLPAKDLYIYLSDPQNKKKCDKIIYNGIKPAIETTDATDMIGKLFQLFGNKQRQKYFKAFLSIDDEFAWIDSQNWDYPGHTKEIKQAKKQYLENTMYYLKSSAATFAKMSAADPSLFLAMGNISHGIKLMNDRDKWNMDHILHRCIEIFDQMNKRHNCKSRAIYPDPKYMIHANEARGRRKQWELGKHRSLTNEKVDVLSQYCYMGDWNMFQMHLALHFGDNVDFNLLFTGEIEFSLLFETMCGHRDFMRKNKLLVEYSETQVPEHFKIAQYMLDNGLDVDIQNRFGYTTLQ
eukprot:138095_1